ncbi:hypothetical protein K474DRAFT_1583712, partial [Panus rudis PR-1116 ss-1]
PPPGLLKPDSPSTVEQARARVLPRRSFFRLSNLRKSKGQEPVNPSLSRSQTSFQRLSLPAGPDEDTQEVEINDALLTTTNLEESHEKDVYQWAFLYENQRGITLFSVPYYSHLSLLPWDPPAFTIPSSSSSMKKQPTVSLSDYPLPDGTWKWVSKTWMVDMRGDGQTQYDGFEYNWFFRKTYWRAEIGPLGAGGWVRRRRWVRLMMRPAVETRHAENPSLPLLDVTHTEAGATRPPSVVLSDNDSEQDEREVWRGDYGDWVRCRNALRKLRDAKKLELWKQWLGLEDDVMVWTFSDPTQLSDKGRTREPQKQWSEDSDLMPSQKAAPLRQTERGASAAPKEYIARTLRRHGTEILQIFVYPDSRSRFLHMLSRVHLLSALLEHDDLVSHPILDFWSSHHTL